MTKAAKARLHELIWYLRKIHPMFQAIWAELKELERRDRDPSPGTVLMQFGATLAARMDELTDEELCAIGAELEDAHRYPFPEVAGTITMSFLDAFCGGGHVQPKSQRMVDRLGPRCFYYCRETTLPDKWGRPLRQRVTRHFLAATFGRIFADLCAIWQRVLSTVFWY